jgi:hypothetical protein
LRNERSGERTNLPRRHEPTHLPPIELQPLGEEPHEQRQCSYDDRACTAHECREPRCASKRAEVEDAQCGRIGRVVRLEIRHRRDCLLFGGDLLYGIALSATSFLRCALTSVLVSRGASRTALTSSTEMGLTRFAGFPARRIS